MSGLLYMSARPFAVHAQSSAVSAIRHLVKGKQGKLQFYDVLQHESPAPLSGLTLAFVNDLPTFKFKAASVLQTLPQVPRDVITNSAAVRANFAEAIKAREVAAKMQAWESLPSPDIHPERRPVLQPSGLPFTEELDPDTLILDDDDSGYEDDDYKNTPDYDPDQDPDAEFYTEHVDAWMKADIEESVRVAKPRLYSHLEVRIMNDKASASDDPEPNVESSCSLEPTLLPYLYIHQILRRQDLTALEEEESIKGLVKRYRYLTSDEGYRRLRLFKQEDPAFPRWLMIQEFTDLYVDPPSLKKQEAEFWWRKNGCDGVIVEFFRRRETQ